MHLQVDPISNPLLDPAYLGSVVFPWLNTGAALITLGLVAWYGLKMRSLTPAVIVAMPSVLLCGIGYGLFAMNIIDQAGLTTIVRPAIPLLLLSAGLSCITEYHRRKAWTNKLKHSSS